MAKISRIQGPSDKNEHPAVPIKRAVLGGELQSVGGNSSVSPESAPTAEGSKSPSHRQPAQTTENRSGATEVASGARTTAGAGHKTASRQSAKKAPAKHTVKKATTRNVNDDEDDDF